MTLSTTTRKPLTDVRSVPEWIGRSPDEAPPPRVRARVFLAKDGRCGQCGRKIVGETWTCEHVVAIINGGANRESNLGVTCSWCLPAKNAEDVAIKSKTARMRAKHHGIKSKGRPMPGSRASPWKQKIGGGWEWRT